MTGHATNLRGLILALCCIVMSSKTVLADQHACVVPESLIEAHLDWIERNTNYDVTPVLQNRPTITACMIGDIIQYAGEGMVVDESIEGLYDPVDHMIILVEPIDFATVSGSGVLLHELIHAVQLTNRTWPCIGGPEWEAYKLHESWLAEQGMTADFDWLAIYFQSRCPPDVHPD